MSTVIEAAPGVVTTAAEEKVAVATQLQLTWWRFRRHKVAVASAFIVAFFYLFHLTVFLAVEISFLPHMVAMACFLPLERINPRELIRNAPNLPGQIRRKLQARNGIPVQKRPDEPAEEAAPAS